MSSLTHIAALAAAGATGTLLRAGCTTLAARVLGTAFPWGTLAVNVAGSFAIGAVVALARSRPLPPEIESLVIVGLLGGFTTYSSFALQSVEMVQAGRSGAAIAYLAATNLLALAAVWAGLRLAG
ncbi:MAG: fluoride efflux transporter FluC [Pirellulales bacterium]